MIQSGQKLQGQDLAQILLAEQGTFLAIAPTGGSYWVYCLAHHSIVGLQEAVTVQEKEGQMTLIPTQALTPQEQTQAGGGVGQWVVEKVSDLLPANVPASVAQGQQIVRQQFGQQQPFGTIRR